MPPNLNHKLGKPSKTRAHGSIFEVQDLATLPDPKRLHQGTPLPYPTNLTLDQSPLWPYCVARDRIRLWCPMNTQTATDSQEKPIPLTQQDLKCIEGVALNSLQPGTQASYRTGLLAFHVFCNHKKISEEMRAPVDVLVRKLEHWSHFFLILPPQMLSPFYLSLCFPSRTA